MQEVDTDKSAEAQPRERYPLWCVDTGDEWSEERYRGPFESSAEAWANATDGERVRRAEAHWDDQQSKGYR